MGTDFLFISGHRPSEDRMDDEDRTGKAGPYTPLRTITTEHGGGAECRLQCGKHIPKVLDTRTFFDGPVSDGNYVGMDTSG
jgi:hypothetical protein